MQAPRQAKKPEWPFTFTTHDMHIGCKPLHILKPVHCDRCFKFFMLTFAHGLPPVLPACILFRHDFFWFWELLVCPVCKALERADHHGHLALFTVMHNEPISRQ